MCGEVYKLLGLRFSRTSDVEYGLRYLDNGRIFNLTLGKMLSH